MEKQVVLQASHICKRFAGVVALEDAQLELLRGEVHALVGANGAGKSTLIKIITGAYSADSGEIRLDGKKVNISSPIAAKRLGISVVYQEFSLVNTLTVGENIFMGALPQKGGKIDWDGVYRRAEEILSQMDTYIDPRALVKDLSVGQKQLVEIAKALSNEAKILIMDEPTASLTDNDVENLFHVVRGLAAKGISIVYVSHRLEEIPQICNRVTVFRDGHYVRTMPIAEATKEVIIESMVGKTLVTQCKVPCVCTEKVLEVRGLTSKGKFADIHFTLCRGEILGITGLAGAGRTELMRAIFGADPYDSGEILLDGKPVSISSPIDAKRNGIGFVTENRKEEGLILGFDLETNISMTILHKLQRVGMLDRKKEHAVAEEMLKSLKVKASSSRQLAQNLSGGNQQKVVIAKWLATNPRILIMDEPTRGIDVGSKSQIYALLNELAAKGLGILVVSSEIPEILEISDRILVMAQGRQTAELVNCDLTQEQILAYATAKTPA